MPLAARTRLKELASGLGLSITTVSRALAGYGDVSAETKERVRSAALASNYVPNRTGRMLVSGRSDFIGMLLPLDEHEIIDSYLSEFVVGLGKGLARRNRDLFLATIPPGQDELTVLRHIVDSRRADGIVLYRTTCDDPRARLLVERRIPFTSHGRTLTLDDHYAWFDTDGEAAFAEAARRLIDLGHREFAALGPAQPYAYAHYRLNGLADALGKAGLKLAPERVVSAPAGDAGAVARAAAHLIDLDPRPTAIFGIKDEFALAVLEAARSRGVAVPTDLSVIGFDDLPIAAYATPALSTFAQRMRESAEILAGMIVDRIERGPGAVEPRLTQPQFIARASHGPAPTRSAPARRPASQLQDQPSTRRNQEKGAQK